MIRRNRQVVVEKEHPVLVRRGNSLSDETIEELTTIRTVEEGDVELNERRYLPTPGQRGKYQEYMIEEVFKLARLGHTNVEIQEFFGISPTTWYKWTKLYPELSQALWRGREADAIKIVDSLHKQALGYVVEETQREYYVDKEGNKKLKVERKINKHVLPSAKAGMYLLKVRFPNKWSETIRTESKSQIDVNITKKVDLSDLSFEELTLMKKLGMKSMPETFNQPALRTIRINKEDVA